jgi:hypothetical protein
MIASKRHNRDQQRLLESRMISDLNGANSNKRGLKSSVPGLCPYVAKKGGPDEINKIHIFFNFLFPNNTIKPVFLDKQPG